MNVNNLLANLIVPLNLSVTLLLLAAILFMVRWRKTAALIAVGAVGWVLFWSLPTSSLWAGGLLEQRYPYIQADRQPVEQAIVVLGGNTANNRDNWFEPYDRSTAVSRIETALKLYEAGRAPLIVVSGAALDGGQSEAHMMAMALSNQGVPSHAIIQEDHSFTTRENAVYTAEVLRRLNIDRILLVTSALHMPRAMASFQKTGLTPTAAPSPPQIVVPEQPDFSFWSPDLRTLDASRSIVKEYLGMLVYWLRGWI
ncbi:YdcF family protein [Castellaniella sp. S9]|uniref:YdcF family protein n=1 Tax=Castellaniella sp. S9 TaxID=2993652 RepID=UPI0022B5AC6E|nr:YdcF family protein [Castellaniella sp. S9]